MENISTSPDQNDRFPSLILRSLPIASYIADLKGQFSGPRFLSESIATAIGFKSDAFVENGDLWPSRIHPEDLSLLQERLRQINDTGSLSVEYRWRCADESERVFLDQAVLVRNERGGPKEIHGTCLDITHRRQIEQVLLQSHRIEAVGQLTSGLAHDFNNMLSVIIWNLDLLNRSLKGTGRNYEYVQTAMGGALNCSELIRQLLTFARTKRHHARVIDICEVIPRAARRAASIVGEGIKMTIILPDKCLPIFVDPAQIESALINLAINARDAMPGGGTLTVECSDIVSDTIKDEIAPGSYVMISVIDTGFGMSQDILDRVFDPCFTTKDPGQGSGLGLSMVYRFVNQSGGYVRIKSAVGAGTTVRLYLPETELAPAEQISTHDVNDDLPMPNLGSVIMVVEDNTNLRRMAAVHLEEMGYHVLEAENAEAALDILRTDQPVDLLFTDVVMPGGMDGFALARISIELRPAIKVLFTSGYISSDSHVGGMSEGFVQKPYRDDELRFALRSLILKDQPAFAQPDKNNVPSSVTIET